MRACETPDHCPECATGWHPTNQATAKRPARSFAWVVRFRAGQETSEIHVPTDANWQDRPGLL